MFVRLFVLFATAIAFTTTAFAQSPIKAKRQPKAPIDINKTIFISYGSSTWNTNSAQIDSAFIVLRDKTSGKLVQISLEESEPDSALFVGQFSVNWGATESLAPEVFIPPANARDSEKDYKKIFAMIQDNSLKSKPLIWKKNLKGLTVLDVYDSQEQADAAAKAYHQAQQQPKKELLKPVPSPEALAAAALAEQKARLEKLALEAAKREADRVRLEQLEKQKAEERIRQAKLASEKERAERKEKAEKIAQEAMELYKAADYLNAEAKFKASVELDPENKNYYFQYAITLYRNQKYNDALVMFSLTKVEGASAIEKTYYEGLCHYRLKEFEPAVKAFTEAAASGDKMMAPSAMFYTGVVQFAQEKYEEAKKNFETVIDTSEDARLDEQAESYLDQIATQLIYKKMRENKWTLTGTVGLMYDSNVLLAPDSAIDQGSSTNVADFRFMTNADAEYRPVLSEHHEWSAKMNASLLNSVKNEAAIADPYQFSIGLPYSYKGVMGSKGVKWTFKPSFETLLMSPDGTKDKGLVLSSYLALFEGTWIMSQSYFATYNFEYRIDNSNLADSLGKNDSDATKYSLRTIQSFFLDKAKKEALMGNLGYVLNAAKGDNKLYQRLEGGVTYARPTSWDASLTLGLSIYKLTFPKADEKRDDFNVTLTTGVSKPVKEWMTWSVIGSYTKNDSSLATTYEYSHWTLMTVGTFTTML